MKRASEDALLDQMMADCEETRRVIVQGQNTFGPREGEMQVRGILQEYQTLKMVDGSKKNIGQPRPPGRNMIKTRDGTKTYPEPLSMRVKVLGLTPSKGQCEPLEDGSGYRVLCSVTYQPDAERWVMEHYDAFVNGQYKETVPIGNYVDEEGNLIKERWITVEKGAIMKMKVGDSRPKNGVGENIFRSQLPGGGLVVVPRTCLTFNKCVAEQFVAMQNPRAPAQQQQQPAAEEGGATAAESAPPVARALPVAYTSLHCKGWATLDPNHDSTLPESELMHLNTDKDVHNFVPIQEYRETKGQSMPYNMYLYTRHRYQSPYPRRGPGITVLRVRNEALEDFLLVRDGVKLPRYVCRLIVWQWHDTVQMTDKYTLKILGQKECWRSFGITNPEVYASILHAHYTLPCHAEANLWRNSALTSPVNSEHEMATRSDAGKFKGDYTYGTDSVLVDYLRYLPAEGIRVSAERVLHEFEQWQGTVGREKRLTLVLHPLQDAEGGVPANPLHTQGLNSPVVSLGNGQPAPPSPDAPPGDDVVYPNHGFAGDVRPLLVDPDLCEFYALTSRPLETDEEHAQARTNGDALLDRLIDEQHAHYWLFAVRKSALQKSREALEREQAEARRVTDALRQQPMEEDDADEEHVVNEPAAAAPPAEAPQEEEEEEAQPPRDDEEAEEKAKPRRAAKTRRQ
jgi:hypothetical protein